MVATDAQIRRCGTAVAFSDERGECYLDVSGRKATRYGSNDWLVDGWGWESERAGRVRASYGSGVKSKQACQEMKSNGNFADENLVSARQTLNVAQRVLHCSTNITVWYGEVPSS
jgi:hypothetical protein